MTSLEAFLIGHPSVCRYCSICGSSSLIQINLSTRGWGGAGAVSNTLCSPFPEGDVLLHSLYTAFEQAKQK